MCDITDATISAITMPKITNSISEIGKVVKQKKPRQKKQIELIIEEVVPIVDKLPIVDKSLIVENPPNIDIKNVCGFKYLKTVAKKASKEL